MTKQQDRKRKELIQHLNSSGAKYFCNELGKPFGFLKVRGHNECLPLHSKKFSAVLRLFAREELRFDVTKETRKRIVDDLADEAELNSIRTYNRFAYRDGKILIDLANESWQQVEVCDQGWSLIENEVPTFTRHEHQQPLPIPAQSNRPNDLFDHIPISCPHQQLVILAWIVSSFHCKIAKPILMLIGPQGACKTTTGRHVRSLLDPSVVPTLGATGERDALQVVDHHAVPMFDNLGNMNRREADFYCRVVTGGGVERRKLYTDDEPLITTYKRSMIMNGLHLPTMRSDFLDRCLIVRCERQAVFKPDSEVEQAFQYAKPAIFGSLLDLLARTLDAVKTTSVTGEFRLADFARFGRAVAIALGKPKEDFDVAYRMTLSEQQTEQLEDCIVCRCLVEMTTVEAGTYTAQDLLIRLQEVAKDKGWTYKPSDWPGSPRWLSTRIEEKAPVLRKLGVIVERLRRTRNERPWRVAKGSEISNSNEPIENEQRDATLIV